MVATGDIHRVSTTSRDGMQDVWHYHVHVVPRFAGDNSLHLRQTAREYACRSGRPYVLKLKQALAINQ